MIIDILSLVSAGIFLLSVVCAFMLSKETDHERYWFILALGYAIFLIHHIIMFPGLINDRYSYYFEIISSLLGSLLIAYAMFGLYSSLKRVKKRLG